ncbi:hypothetical protein EVAR_25703_1 [Eumeta japonica]|uniref:Uncharacterized protein n=1 Tax=Eumeta variegata TaxID=151549 RepID=A0A4C1YVH7_EUMVA|nr:hypothetical protein EVAR_25703_1 [Eumeta japonica]
MTRRTTLSPTTCSCSTARGFSRTGGQSRNLSENFAHGFSCLHELITAATPDTYVRVHSSQQNIFSVAFHFPTKTKHVDAQVLSRATSATSLYYSRAGEATPCAAVTYLPVAAMNVSLERKTPGASLCVCNTQDVLGKLLFNLCTYGLVN